MTVVYPEWLWLLAGIPVLGVLLLIGVRSGRRTVSRLVGTHSRAEVLTVLTVKQVISAVLVTVGLASLIVALAGPRWGSISVEDERRGLDVVFLMDVSNSMVAEDIPPSRLGRSREVARSLADRLDGAYHAVVAFKGAATVVVPMTEDPVAFDLAIGNLTGALITASGTSLENGLTTALAAFPSGTPRHRAIVLFSDGQELQDAVREQSDALRRSGIPVYAVLTGTQTGATIPTRDGGVLTDETGQPVIAAANRAVLEELAMISGGSFYDIAESGVAQRIAADLNRLGGRGRAVVFRETAVERYHLFVLVALVSLAGVVIVQNTRWGNTL